VGFAVELYFDPSMERRIRRLWQELADQGIRSILPAIGSRPHISLALLDRVDPTTAPAVLASLASDQMPLPVEFSSAGTFPGTEGVVFLAPAITPELLAIHRRVYSHLTALGLRVHEYYRPGRWVPHCTVAMELEPHQVPQALAVCRGEHLFVPATLVEIGLVEYRPVREICSFPLSLAAGPDRAI
jgi:2'-5' RNA ligase